MGVRPSAAEALVVLGGGVTPNGAPTPATQRRLEKAIEVYRRTDFGIFIASGKCSRNLRNVPTIVEADVIGIAAIASGVDPRKVRRERSSRSTLENILRCKKEILIPEQVHSISVVTDSKYAARTEQILGLVLAHSIEYQIITTDAPTSADRFELQGISDLETRIQHITPGNDAQIEELIRQEDEQARLLLLRCA